VRVPETAGSGIARITVTFNAWREGQVASSHHQIPVDFPKQDMKLEPVSARLRREFVHPNRTNSLVGLRFSPDGARIIAASESGSLAIWEVASGKEVRILETGSRLHEGGHFIVSSDCETLVVRQTTMTTQRVEQDGNQLTRYQFDGGLRIWDLTTGRVKRFLKHEPARHYLSLSLSPDGSTLATVEWLPGTYQSRPNRAGTVWNVETGKSQLVANGLWHCLFSPDGRTLATDDPSGSSFAHAMKVFDKETCKEKRSIPIPDGNAFVHCLSFSPDGHLLVACYGIYPQGLLGKESRGRIKCWNTDTGQEMASYAAEDETAWWSGFSPDGKVLAAMTTNRRLDTPKVLLFQVSSGEWIRTAKLGEQKGGERLLAREPAFSPDGRLLAVITQASVDGKYQDALNLPQPRIHLIDAGTGQIRDTLISPQAIPGRPCFSHDGRTLATGGYGKVLLWDVKELLSSDIGIRH
jgi:WD40 repeat protein